MTAGSCEFSSCRSTCICQCYRQRNPDWNELGATSCHDSNAQFDRRRRLLPTQISRSRTSFLRWKSLNSFMFAVLFSIFFCSGWARAENAPPLHGRLRQEDLLFDRREAPSLPMQLNLDRRRVLSRRDNSAGSSTLESNRDETTEQLQVPLPVPFDSSLGKNFTSPSCPAFFQKFLNDQSFRNCLPFSLLLQTSSAFFTISQSLVRLTETLDASCRVDYQQCSALMGTLAQQIQLNENCGADLQMQNPMVEQAYDGFMAYQPLFHAGCLRDDGGNFCYANAVSDTSSPTSSFIYYLPLGVQLPGGSQPVCNACLQNTMAIFAAYTGSSNQPLSSDYIPAAQQLDMSCGPRFVESSVHVTSSAEILAGRNDLVLLALLLCLIYILF